MKKFESFLKSAYYPPLVAVLSAIAWMFNGNLVWINYGFITLYLVTAVLILSFFKDTKYLIPMILGLFFMINTQRIGMDVLGRFSIAYFMAGLVTVGMVTHFIRFRHRFKLSWLGVSFLFIGISYLIPLFYTDVTIISVVLSLTGLLYFAFYLFIKDTTKVRLDEIFNYFFYASLTLLIQMSYVIIKQFIVLIEDHSFLETIYLGVYHRWEYYDFGFANTNSMIIYLTILSSGLMYKIIKYPYNFTYWFVGLWQILIVILSGSRGGYLAWVLLLFIYVILLVTFGKKWQILIVGGITMFAVFVGLSNKDFIDAIYEVISRGGLDDLDSFSTLRLSLFKEGFEVFKQYPYFGAGWTHAYEPDHLNPTRVMIYHSTIVQTLAMTGLFGMATVIFYSVAASSTAFRRMNLEVALAITVWGVTMIHGLIDNTMHLIIYTMLTMILLSAIEKERKVIHKSDFVDYLSIHQILK